MGSGDSWRQLKEGLYCSVIQRFAGILTGLQTAWGWSEVSGVERRELGSYASPPSLEVA